MCPMKSVESWCCRAKSYPTNINSSGINDSDFYLLGCNLTNSMGELNFSMIRSTDWGILESTFQRIPKLSRPPTH